MHARMPRCVSCMHGMGTMHADGAGHVAGLCVEYTALTAETSYTAMTAVGFVLYAKDGFDRDRRV